MSKKHVYLVGIGGVGMVWIADYALAQGWKVSGSDINSSDTVERLQNAGAEIHLGSQPDAIPADVTEAVITSAATESSPSYPEVHELQKRGIPVMKRAEWIGKLTKQKFTIAIAGTHGKTTTTAMIGWVMEKAGLDPTVFVGGSLKAWGQATRIGKSQYLVLEADEFDRSFHRFYPQIAVVLNIDLDHTDYYTKGLPEIEHAFKRFLRNLPAGKGMVVGYGRDGRIRKAARGFKYRFRWYDEEQLWPGLQLAQKGSHLRLNATAAARVAHELGVDQKTILSALASFPGVGRRMEYLGRWNQAELYDDYGHHPTEIQATLQAMHEQFPATRTTLVYQPHQKARTAALLAQFGRAFDQAPPNRLILAPIYQVAGREGEEEISSQDIANEVTKQSPKGLEEVLVAQDNGQLEQLVKKSTEDPGVMVVMGAGDIRSLIEEWR